MDININGFKKNVHKKIINLPGDKSIAHRSLIIGSISKGNYNIYNFPKSEDCITTLEIMKTLGVKAVYGNNNVISIISPGVENFKKDAGILNCNNSGTTVRLLLGLLCGANIKSTLIGDESLSKRPMKRVIEPLELMGGNIKSSEDKLPIETTNTSVLKDMKYFMSVASAQVKSALLIAALVASKNIVIKENLNTRDHTEIMMKYLGANIKVQGDIISLEKSILTSRDIYIPGDISSAAFLIGLCILSEKSSISIKEVLINSRRSKFIDILISMGANIEVENKLNKSGELVGDIRVTSSKLKAVEVLSYDTPNIIDEIPMLSVLAAFSQGTTVIRAVDELKVKESNRLNGIINNLSLCGIRAWYEKGDLFIEGKSGYINKDVTIETEKDHRIAMAFAVLSIRNLKTTRIKHWQCTNISFPENIKFFSKFLNIDYI
ncbi:3-phosphoshikimate 1-carboxyvinyltransferase [Clostridium sp. MSJ-4]|uniref:3-phosphoshikimate 1-carboxyvinyltransferase n=1 Tax=Clostridium simiarum TaxID=2841506 RepID=A0ABS6EZJ7_9CLOT|nr:3-phosphoshikimate 1-carboxyvinyltransferase [Clostridium simiarum]MBU5590782.1 3-phosphoshikimate 1-carboxyvinyltransferase [Clostridium simiarum]